MNARDVITIEGRKLSTLVEAATRKEPWIASKHPSLPHKNDRQVSTATRCEELQTILDRELEKAVRELCPGHPAIPLFQILDMDTHKGRVDMEIITEYASELIGRVREIHQALTMLGLKVSLVCTGFPHASGEPPDPSPCISLCVNLPSPADSKRTDELAPSLETPSAQRRRLSTTWRTA